MSNKKIKVRFSHLEKPIEIQAGQTFDQDGEDGSILQIALEHGVEIDHACGGVSACSTCHVVISEGINNCNEANDDELDQLDNAPGLQMESRLACQCVPHDDVTVEIPTWNRNRVPSDH